MLLSQYRSRSSSVKLAVSRFVSETGCLFRLITAIVGFYTGSLALVADAFHYASNPFNVHSDRQTSNV